MLGQVGEEGQKSGALPAKFMPLCRDHVPKGGTFLLHSLYISHQRLWWVELSSRAQEKRFLFHNDSRQAESKI